MPDAKFAPAKGGAKTAGGKAGGKGQFLGQPTWVWVAGAAAIGVGLLYMRRQDQQQAGKKGGQGGGGRGGGNQDHTVWREIFVHDNRTGISWEQLLHWLHDHQGHPQPHHKPPHHVPVDEGPGG